MKLRAAATPLVLAGALWSGNALLSPAPGRAAQTPSPCGPDGVCLPKADTYGVYQTRWRKFPGDVLLRTPTKATEEPAEEGEETLGGPQPPSPTEEGQIGPPRERRGTAPGAEGAPAPGPEGGTETPPGLPPLPGEEPAPGPGAVAPPAEGAAPAGPAEEPAPLIPPTDNAPGPAPGTVDPNLLDPFSTAPPTPPAWLRSAAAAMAPKANLQPLPEIEPAFAIAEPMENVQAVTPAVELQNQAPPAPTINAPPAVLEAPNLKGDDAPPVLPPALQGVAASAASRPAWTPYTVNALPPAMPTSVRPTVDAKVAQASAEIQAGGVQLVNPAALDVDQTSGGVEQAIYVEASDLPAK